VSVLVVAQPSSEVPEGFMNYPVQEVSDVTRVRVTQILSYKDSLGAWTRAVISYGYTGFIL
jgi:hypothetical protein